MAKEKNIYPHSMETRTILLEHSIGQINQTLTRIETDLKDLRKETHSNFKWVLGMIFGLSAFTVSGFAGTLAIIAHGFHWL